MFERVASSLGFVRAPKSQAPYAKGPYAKVRVQMAVQGYDPRRGANMLRGWSRNNEWVRLAIDYRREQISKAKWKIVRLDDPKQAPNPNVEKAIRQLFKIVNAKRESFESLLDMVIDDVLVLDAGCIEKEKTIGGDIHALWAVDGSTIVPDPTWDGHDPKAARYFQIIDGKEVADFRNDQLIYMMRTPTTYSPIGWSPVETLMRVIEADLYGEQYDFSALKQTAPAGVLDLGPGITPEDVEKFRTYYEDEIAGSQQIAIFGGGEPGAGSGVKWNQFGYSNRESERSAYREWLVRKIAAVFRIDKTLFNITDSVNRATSKTQQARTDEGLEALSSTLERYITREIIWEFDENHGFAFDDISGNDQAQQAQIDTTYVGSGIWLINEVRARQGLDPVAWGDDPWGGVKGEPVAPEPEDDEEDNAPQNPGEDDEPDKKKSGSATRVAPFVRYAARAAARMRSESLGYLDSSETSSEENVAG